MSKLYSLSDNKTFEALFSEIADDLAEAINGGAAHKCHTQVIDFTWGETGSDIIRGNSNPVH